MTTEESVSAWGTLAGVFIVAVLAQINAWRARQVSDAVSKQLASSTERRDSALANIHALVNSNLTLKMQQLMELSAKVAELTNDIEAHKKAAAAKLEYEDQLARAKVIDQTLIQLKPQPNDKGKDI